MGKTPINAKLYQWIYENIEGYGRAEKSHCPGIRAYPYSKQWINPKKPLKDLGCGTGQTVEFYRKKNIDARGCDWINPINEHCRQGDITKTMDLGRYYTVTCFDVIEHLNNAQVKGLFLNMVQCERQIFTIANTPSIIKKGEEEIDLHINKKSFPTWRGIIIDYFDIVQEFEMRDYQHLYLCQRKQGDKSLINYLENKGYIITKEDEKWL